MHYSLIFTKSQHEELCRHLFVEDNCESVAILLCHRARGARSARLMLSELIPIPAEDCNKRTATRVDWPIGEYLTADKITEIDQGGLSIVTIHSHPNGMDEFSHTDDENDRRIFKSIGSWFDDGRPNGAAIMMPDGKIIARVVDAKGKFKPMENVAVVSEDIKIWPQSKRAAKPPKASARIAQAFGKNTLDLLRRLRVGVIGCSGTGSIVVELLARNCVGQLVIVDADRIEHKNLNRIVNATDLDAQQSRPKVEALKQAVEAMGTGARVEAHQARTDDPKVVEALIGCDVIFGCVDSAEGRYHLECIASACWLPYFDVGVRLEIGADGDIKQAISVAHYMHPENASLLSRGAYTSEQVTAESHHRNSPEYYEQQRKDGYLADVGEDQPAVISVNMQAACMSFNDFLARLHGFRLDANDEFATQRFQLVHGHYENHQAKADKPDSLFGKYSGMGDASQLLQQLKRRAN